MRIRGGKVYCPDGKFHDRDIFIQEGRFTESSSDGMECDASSYYLIPGLTDLHFHGCVGADFCDATPESLLKIAGYEAANGIANICPASMTLPEETLARVYRNAAAYERQGGSYLVGINMEGPFFSYEKRGAQNPAYLRAPDVQMVRRLQKEAGGLIKLVDVAPETEGALPFIEELKGEFRLSLAHTNADYDQAVEGFRAGATQVTHLYNAMSGMSHRAPGVVGAALENGECYVELICDGVHVVPPMIRNTFQMFGEDRIILISDSLSATGMPDGLYELGGQAVRVIDGKATIADTGAIAGSTSNLMDCLKFAVKKAKIPLESAVKCATINPAKSLGIDDEYGSIEPGKRAQLVFLDENLEVTAVWL